MKKIISLLLSVAVIASVAVSSVGNASAKSKKFYANKKSVTVSSGKKTTVKITSKKGKKLTFTIANGSICTAKFGKWKGKKITLKITGKKAGKTNITIKNKKTKKKIKIKVAVKEKKSAAKPVFKIKLMSAPFTISNTTQNYYRPADPPTVDEKVNITKVWTVTEDLYGSPSAVLYIKGNKTYSSSPEKATTVAIPYKIYNNTLGGMEVESSTIYTDDIKVGESFQCSERLFDLDTSYSYTIKFFDYETTFKL